VWWEGRATQNGRDIYAEKMRSSRLWSPGVCQKVRRQVRDEWRVGRDRK
jgi:hypothetical protein